MATVTKTTTIKVTGCTSVVLTYSITETDTDVTIRYTNVKWTNTRSGGLTEGIYWSLTATPKTAGIFPSLNASGSASKGAKTWSKALSVSKTTAKTHAAVSGGIAPLAEFSGNTSGDQWHKLGSVSYTRPALKTYAVTLNANGGTGGTASLTKWHGEPLSLTSGVVAPTKDGYRFDGWATADDAVKADAVTTYTENEVTTFYAIWTPIITGVSLTVHTIRVDDGTATVESDDGTYCYGTIAYEVAGAAAGTLSLTVSVAGSVVFDSGRQATITKSAGTQLSGTCVFRAHNCDTDSNFTFYVNASCTNDSVAGEQPRRYVFEDVLSAAYFPMDILGDNYWDADTQTGERPGHGIAFGTPCKKEGFAVGMDLFFRQWAGVIQMFAGTTPPAGWLLCDGSAVSRREYSALFEAIGTTWGVGDDATTFNLPDLRGRTAVGVDPNGSIDSYAESSNMLLTDTATIAQEAYCSYKLKLNGRSLAANTRYTLQLFDVHMCHGGKTETTIGLKVYWGGGGTANELSSFIAADPNNDGETTLKSYTSDGLVYAYCKHLVITLDATGKTQGDNLLWIYNSPADASGTRFMEIGRWMLTEESDGALPWEPRRFFHRFGAFDLGGTGGIDHPDVRTEHMPSHTHSTPNHTHTFTGNRDASSDLSGSNPSPRGDVMRMGSGYTWTITNSTGGGTSGSTGGNNSFDVRQSYAAVNYIIHTGKVS